MFLGASSLMLATNWIASPSANRPAGS